MSQIKQTLPSKIRFPDEATPSTAPPAPVTPSNPGTDTTNVINTPSSDDLYTVSFNFALIKILSSTLMASLTSKYAILKELRDCINTWNEDRCIQIIPNIHSYWKDIHVKNGCVRVDDGIAIPNSIKEADVRVIHATHPVSWGMTDMAVHAWWPFMHRNLVSKTAKWNPCVKIGKNLKSIITSIKRALLKLRKLPNEEIQIDFGGPICNEKTQGVYFLAYIDRFSKLPTAKVIDRANAQIILKFLQDYVFLHGTPRTIKLDPAQCQIGQQVRAFLQS